MIKKCTLTDRIRDKLLSSDEEFEHIVKYIDILEGQLCFREQQMVYLKVIARILNENISKLRGEKADNSFLDEF